MKFEVRINDKEYRTGDTVPESGIYDVVHDTNHAEKHQVTCIKGERFPPCRGSSDGYRFVLNQPALHISEHPAFRPSFQNSIRS